MSATVDERGRILLPKTLREAHGLTPGSPVIIESTNEGIRLRRALPKDEALRRLAGAINEKTRREETKPEDAFAGKKLWEPKP